MAFTGELRDHGGDIGEAGVEVAAGHRRRGVTREGLGNGIASETTNRGYRGVP